MTNTYDPIAGQAIRDDNPFSRSISFTIDESDTITAVKEAGDMFAVANSSPSLGFVQVKWRQLWEQISDQTTAQLYRDLLAKVWKGCQVEAHLRCDSPTLRRRLTLTPNPPPNGTVEFRSTTVRQESREPVALLDPVVPRPAAMIHSCGWCRGINLSKNLWVELEDAVRELLFFELSMIPIVTHGNCPVCTEDALQSLAKPANPRESR